MKNKNGVMMIIASACFGLVLIDYIFKLGLFGTTLSFKNVSATFLAFLILFYAWRRGVNRS